jgi:maltooligosyltrehalose trehalohydrolase
MRYKVAHSHFFERSSEDRLLQQTLAHIVTHNKGSVLQSFSPVRHLHPHGLMLMEVPRRRLPVGAEVLAEGGVHFRVWAPKRKTVAVVFEDATHSRRPEPLRSETGGYFSATIASARAGDLYRFQLDRSERFPDPASRFQPDGPHGPSQVTDPRSFAWTDDSWNGVAPAGQAIYELHIGTFTQQGTWAAAMERLPDLATLGITVLEVMPVADFPGQFGWGYDGVNLFAPTRLYGPPDDFRRFVDRAHNVGLGVILDVVYNHFGPDGNYLKQFANDYFTDRYPNEWGEAIDFDGENSGPVREYFIANAAYWIDEFHLDGLRLDATQQIFDQSDESILTAVARSVRQTAGRRATLVVAENEAQEAHLARRPEDGGCGIDALWNDDFHHSCRVLLTGHREGYYSDFTGTAQEILSAVKWGYLYQGQWYPWQKKGRGTSTRGLAPVNFVTYLENHDQVANSVLGYRLHRLTDFGRYKAMTALLLLAPQTPMLFQGQEFAASCPFLYFADHNRELARLVHEGRKKFLSQFPSMATSEMSALVPDPSDRTTFECCKLNWTERQEHQAVYALHHDLLHLRGHDPVFRAQQAGKIEGAVLERDAFVLRFMGPDDNDRLLICNFGIDHPFGCEGEPLLAPLTGRQWSILWSSEHPRYGGGGTPPWQSDGVSTIKGHSAVVLA